MDLLLKQALHLASHLQKEGWPTVIVGGALRDLLLGRPLRDVDLATEAPLTALADHFDGTVLVGKPPRQSALVFWQGGRFEIVSHAGRSLDEELRRRDLTVNALALTPSLAFVDPWGAVVDIAARRLRFNGTASARLIEDPLRALRLFRFAATLEGFSLDETSREAADGADLTDVTADRRGGELLKAAEGNLSLFLSLLAQGGLLARAYPELASLAEDPLLTRTKRRLSRICPMTSDCALRLTALLLDGLSREEGAEALKRWQWPHALSRTVRRLLDDPSLRGEGPLLRGRHLRWNAEDRQRLLLLAAADSDDEQSRRRWIEGILRTLTAEEKGLFQSRLVTGREAASALGRPPGPVLGEALRELDDALARDELTGDREEALGWLASWARKREERGAGS
ncbi:MAG: CCA tRNA nucleotidyltransferase [Synergistaceae bacterium]|nr:CCA tRNA nucleotidyltransferase [Synergistaceae bacterium]